jgi:hypothetical protein
MSVVSCAFFLQQLPLLMKVHPWSTRGILTLMAVYSVSSRFQFSPDLKEEKQTENKHLHTCIKSFSMDLVPLMSTTSGPWRNQSRGIPLCNG